MTRALLIVDVQNDFTEGGALACAGGASVARAISEHVRSQPYDLVAASRDWHNAAGDNGGHFAHGEPDFVSTWPVHCVAETVGADYHPCLDTTRIDVHIKKGQGVPAYSAFEGVADDGRSLADVLRAEGVTEVDIVGIATDYCVKATALDAQREGFATRVIAGLTASVADETRAAALDELRFTGITVA